MPNVISQDRYQLLEFHADIFFDFTISEWRQTSWFGSIPVLDESWNFNYPIMNDRQGLSIRTKLTIVKLYSIVYTV